LYKVADGQPDERQNPEANYPHKTMHASAIKSFSRNNADWEISSGTGQETVRAFVAATRSPGDSMQFVALRGPLGGTTRQKSEVPIFQTIHTALKRLKNSFSSSDPSASGSSLATSVLRYRPTKAYSLSPETSFDDRHSTPLSSRPYQIWSSEPVPVPKR
jgi:hypothetical protein